MSEQHMLSAYNSGTSTETSESQGFEENTNGCGVPEAIISRSTSSSRTAKVWKRMKEASVEKDAAEAKRPPWRAVSISTLPKPDKNAILRAKLLDASRRLRAGKTGIAVQTDFVPTTLMKEVSLGIQVDLKHLNDVGILTDGSYVMRKQGSKEFILTYSVSQMTEAIPLRSASTQTLLPKVSGDAFIEAYYKEGRGAQNLTVFSHVEQKLLKEVHDLRVAERLRAQAEGESRGDESPSAMSVSYTKAISKETFSPASSSCSFLKPTYSSWHFEFDDHNFFEPYTLIRARSRDFNSGRRSPASDWPAGRSDTQEYRAINIQAYALNAIDELILESNNLLDFVEDLSAKSEAYRNPTVYEQSAVAEYKQTVPNFPSDYWLPIVEEQERDLTEKISSLKYQIIRRVSKLDL